MRQFQFFLIFVYCVAGALSQGLPAPGGESVAFAESASVYSDSELFSAETREEAKIRSLRDQEITQLRSVLGRRQPKNRQAELYYRLAEIYLEAYRQTFLLEGRVHEKRMSQGQSGKTTIDRSHSKPYLLLGIKASKDIIATGIQYEQMDRVLYFLGFNYGELGDRRESVNYFTELAHRYPQSPFVAEAYREMGDAAVEHARFREAQQDYQQSLQKAPPENAPRLYHKLAWAYYRTKNFEAAISAMKNAIDLARRSGEKYLSLHEEALRDMALFMTESGRVEEAISYFQQVVPDPNYYGKTLERLGKQYERNVEPVKATEVYESLLKTHPETEAAFRVLVKLVDLDLRRGRYQDALSRVQSSRIPSSFKEEETQASSQNLRAMMRRTATEHHEKFRKKGDRGALLIAAQFYQLYLSKFLAQEDPRKETPEIEMYLAEVDRELGKSKEASDLYRAVVNSGDPRYAKEAAALWTASLAEAVKKSSPGGTSHPGSTEPSLLEKQYVEAADDLQSTLGGTAEGREAALKAAQILAGYSKTKPESIQRIKKIIEKAPSSPQALVAARLWLQLSIEADPTAEGEFRETVKELRSNAALMEADNGVGKGKIHSVFSEQESRLKIALIAHEEKNKDYAEAARGYEQFAQDSKDRETAEKAFANAVSSYLKAGDSASVERLLEVWLVRFPRSPKATESFRGAATLMLIQGKFEIAANLFEKLGVDAGDADSLETAARIFEATGDRARAANDYGRHVKTYRDSPHRGEIYLALARYDESQKLDREAVQSYRDCMSLSPEWEAHCGAALADLLFRLKNEEEARAVLKRVASQGAGYAARVEAPAETASRRKRGSKSQTPRVRQMPSPQVFSPFVGYARFKLADLLESSQRFEPLELPDAKLKEGMNQRIQFLEPLSRAYDSAVQAGGPWAIAALDHLARWAANFADDVDRIAPPPGLDEKGAAQFRANLSAISGPLRKKAQDTWADAYRKALAAEVLSPAVPEMADHLADFGASSPLRAQGFHGKFHIAGVPADGGKEGSSLAFEKTRERLQKNPQDAQAWVDYGNLLWGAGHSRLSRIAYERAVALDPRNPSALNNRAVTLVFGVDTEGGSVTGLEASDPGKEGAAPAGTLEEDWIAAAQADALFAEALRKDEFFTPSKLNRALLLNYFRLFEKSRPLLEQILVRNELPEAHDALGIALQGSGSLDRAREEFDQGSRLGLKSSRFAVQFHLAARAAQKGGKDGFKECLSALSEISATELAGFERQSTDRLNKTCSGKEGKKSD